jgi:thiol:disulfide interchange protein
VPYADPRLQHQDEGNVVAFDAEKLDGLRAANKPVFLYFTADWCLTCKAHEAAAIERAEVRAAFEKAGVTVMMGDWTNADPAITRFLEAQGRSGVPLYLWYAPGKEAQTLPQLLTPSTLTGLVR